MRIADLSQWCFLSFLGELLIPLLWISPGVPEAYGVVRLFARRIESPPGHPRRVLFFFRLVLDFPYSLLI